MTAPGKNPAAADRANANVLAGKLGYLLALVFSLLVIYSITLGLFDEANTRFGAIAFGILIVMTTKPLASSGALRRLTKIGWLIDILFIAALAWSAIWFFRVKEELWTGFYVATPTNMAAALLGLVGATRNVAPRLGLVTDHHGDSIRRLRVCRPVAPGSSRTFRHELAEFHADRLVLV